MIEWPKQPFAPKEIDADGGGLDFLGLRWVNLKLLTEDLLPGINNATQDFGTYCLATWIAWKFEKLSTSKRDFTPDRFLRFRETVEVAMSHSMRPGSAATSEFGEPHRNVGVRQKLTLPAKLSFETAKRGNSTSVFSPPLYGPSLKFLNLLRDAEADDGRAANILIPCRDENVTALMEKVDELLASSAAYSKLTRLESASFSESEVDDLALAGLHPARLRRLGKREKRHFLKLLTPDDSSNGRTATARLLVTTIRNISGVTLDDVRAIWHTGLLTSGAPVDLEGHDDQRHRDRWALFQSRQYQRYVIESFMHLFEVGLRDGLRSIDEMATRFHSEGEFGGATLDGFFRSVAAKISSARDWNEISAEWNRKVGPSHPHYIATDTYSFPKGKDISRHVMTLLARWWLPMCEWIGRDDLTETLNLGGEDRVGIRWFHQWVHDRLELPIQAMMRQFFEQLIFAQHIRVALSRFDGESQRLRFVLGDKGIVPTPAMIKKLTDGIPGWTQDRLDAFANLLSDLDVVRFESDRKLQLGELANEVLH